MTDHLPDAKQKKLLSYLRSVSGDAALVLAMRMLFESRTLNVPLRRALVEGLYRLFRGIIPPLKDVLPGCVDSTDNGIFEQSAICWMVLLDKSKDCSSEGTI